MPSLPTLTPLRHCLGRLFVTLSVCVGLAPFSTAQAHPGTHSGSVSARVAHALQSPDHQLTGLLLLAVATILIVCGIRLWRGEVRADRRILSGACLAAAGLIVWSVWHAGGPLST